MSTSTLPGDWTLSSLGQVCSFENGDRGINYPSPGSFVSIGVPFVNAGHLRAGGISLKSMDYITKEAFHRLGGGKFAPGDILFCLRGSLGKFGVVDSETPIGAIASSLVIIRPRPRDVAPDYLAAYLGSELCAQQIEKWAGGAAQPNLGAGDLARFLLPLPPLAEQKKIAYALADIDDLITTLEQLAFKKRALRQGLMQQLLTGRTRLPAFDRSWTARTLGELANIKTGSRNNQDKTPGGLYPFFVRSATVERIDSYSYDCEAILVPGEGGIGSIFHYIDGKFEVHQRVYKISDFSAGVSGRFIYHFMRQFFGAHAMENSVKATVDSLRLPTLRNFAVQLPELEEQAAIAAVLDTADDELESLAHRLAKMRAIKTGMMQQLLTGRTRLPVEVAS
ncbi:MAG: restriction endonuclease subunit S [Nocardioidaceae bacterium]|nr:restriction endonuclease subunit S [Nocardioidaceae bacterium]